MTEFLSSVAYKVMAMALSLMASLGMLSSPSKETPIEPDENASLNFAVWGDIQVSNIVFGREANLKAACEDLASAKAPLDALIVVGDVAENGMKSEYDTVAAMLNTASGSFRNFICTEGNHDVRSRVFSSQLKRFTEFNNSVNNSVKLDGEKYYFAYEINGYKFIVLGTEKTVFEESELSEKQLAWLDGEIASTQGSGKPVFVLCHQPLQNTHGLPGTWNAPTVLKAGSIGKQNDKVKAIFEKYGNVIFITGHLHTGAGKFTYEDFGAFKSINVPSVCIKNSDGVKTSTQGYVFTVYEDRLIARARIFGEGKYIDSTVENAVIEIPLGK